MTMEVVLIVCNWELLNDAYYNSPKVVKRLLRRMINLEHRARKGDSVAQSVLIDLQDAIEAERVLTFKQRKYLKLWLEGYRQIEIAAMHRTSQVNISQTISRSAKNISSFLK